MFKAITSALTVLLVLLSLSAITLAQLPDNPIRVPDSNLPDGPGTRGGAYLTSTTSDATFLNPFLVTGDDASSDVAGLAGVIGFGAPLTGFSGDPIVLINELAETFEVDDLDNPSIVTFKLRSGLRWSDGRPITAADAEFTYMANVDPRYSDIARSESLLINDQYPAFERVDDLTFRYSLPGPVGIGAYLLGLNLTLLPQHVHQAAFDSGDLAAENYWSPQFAATNPSAIVGAGPFRLKSVVLGQEYVFERNPYFWKVDSQGTQLPYFDEVRMIVVEDRDVQLLKFLNGETHDFGYDLSLTESPRPSDLPVIRQRAEQLGVTVDISDPQANGSADFISFNQDIGLVIQNGQAVSAGDPYKDSLRQLFRNRDFRIAMSKTTDRQAIADNIFLGLAAPIFGPSGGGTFDITGRPGSGGELDPAFPAANFEFDPAAANALLDSLDLPIGPDGFRAFGNSYPAAGQRVQIAVRTNVENNQRVESATLLAGDYTDLLHLQSVPEPLPFNAAVADLLNFQLSGGEAFGEWEAFYIGIGGGAVDPTFAFSGDTTTDFLHFYRYSDALATDPSQLRDSQVQIDELWTHQAEVPVVAGEDTVADFPALTFGSTQERFDLVRQLQLLIASEQDAIYTVSQQTLNVFSSKLGNRVTSGFTGLSVPNFAEIGFIK